MTGKIYLYEDYFKDNERILYKDDVLSATAFKYSTGVEAVTIKNDKGYITVLPYMGQMIWDMEFLGHNMVMKSIYDEPERCHETYGESYGCFLMHCGLTAMGNPTAEDTHLPHGELPIAKYKEVYVSVGEDDKGRYISIGGVYSHKRAFVINYDFSPEVKLYVGASTIDVDITFTNKKDLPLEYFYLCHINYRPVDGSKLVYTADRKNITVHNEVPEDYLEPQAQNTRDYIKKLQKDASLMDTVDSSTQSYAPEIVSTCIYNADKDGNAHTMQIMPDGYSCYVCHRPEELPFGVRWIARTEDEDAMGMVLPATSEHMGYIYCKSKGQEKYLPSGESTTFHIRTGILSPEESQELRNIIE